ncbi:MAG: OsmC family protein [Candidatus Methanodesulfokora sp.]
MPQIKGKVVFEGDMRFRASTDRFSMEMSEDGLRPMEAVLLATGACTAMDVVAIIRKAGYEVQGLELELEADREERHPKVFREIRILYKIRGNMPEELVKKAIEMSQSRYCSASIMLKRGGVKVITSFHVINT